MTDRDARPLHSPMSAELKPIMVSSAMAIALLMGEAWDAVMASNPDRLQAELINDALSITAQLIATAGMAFTLQLAEVKGRPLAQAHRIALEDVASRWAALAEAARAAAAVDAGATRQ